MFEGFCRIPETLFSCLQLFQHIVHLRQREVWMLALALLAEGVEFFRNITDVGLQRLVWNGEWKGIKAAIL